MQHRAQIRALLSGITPRKPRVSTYLPAHPWHLEAAYVASLRRRVSGPLASITWQALQPWLARYRGPNERTDADDDFLTAIGHAQLRFAERVDIDAEATAAPARMAPQVEAFSAVQQRAMLRVLGVNPIGDDILLYNAQQAWLADNTARIKLLPQTYWTDLQNHVSQAVHSGMRHETLARELAVKHETLAGWPSERLARDQVSKYNGALAEAQQKAVGVESYQWRAVGDARTRPEHAALDMTVQRWDSPPSIGHPGEPILCRCSACAII